jgi:hypothetical protein
MSVGVGLSEDFMATPSTPWNSSEDDLTESDFDMEVTSGTLSDGDDEEGELDEEDELDEGFINEGTYSTAISSPPPSPSSSPPSSNPPTRTLYKILNPVDPSRFSLSPIGRKSWTCSPGSSPSPPSSPSSPTSPSTHQQNIRLPLSPVHLRNILWKSLGGKSHISRLQNGSSFFVHLILKRSIGYPFVAAGTQHYSGVLYH